MDVKTTYIAEGFRMEGNEIKIILTNQFVRDAPDAMSIVKNITGFIEQMKADASKMKDPDTIHIPIEEFNKMGMNMGDVLEITITKVQPNGR